MDEMTSYILKQDVVWIESLPLSEPSDRIILLGGDGGQVAVPGVLLLAVSPLARNILCDHLPPPYSPIVISIPAVTGDVLQVVGDILATGTAAGVTEEIMDKVEEVFKALELLDSLVVECSDVSKEGLEKEIFIKEEGDIMDRNNGVCDSSETLQEKTEQKIFMKSQQKVQIVRSEEGKIKVRGLWPGQQLVQLPDGQLKIFSSADAGSFPTWSNPKSQRSTSLNSSTKRRGCKTGNVYACNPPIEDPSRPFGCSQCPKRFLRKHHMKEHVLTHSDVMPFSCYICPRRFNRSRELKKHMKLHCNSPEFLDTFQQEGSDFSHHAS